MQKSMEILINEAVEKWNELWPEPFKAKVRMIEKVEIMSFADGTTVEDEIGNKMFVTKNLFSREEDNEYEFNRIAFALGKIFLDRALNHKIPFTSGKVDKTYSEFLNNRHEKDKKEN